MIGDGDGRLLVNSINFILAIPIQLSLENTKRELLHSSGVLGY